MSYKIAIASSDGICVDLKFGEAEKFFIYEVTDTVKLSEERRIPHGKEEKKEDPDSIKVCQGDGCGGNGSGCHGSFDRIPKVDLLSDCRCIVCKKIGFQAQKQFEKKAISIFDVECTVKEALDKITFYYNKIDKHETLRNT